MKLGTGNLTCPQCYPSADGLQAGCVARPPHTARRYNKVSILKAEGYVFAEQHRQLNAEDQACAAWEL